MKSIDKELGKAVLSNPVHFLSFGFGSGLSPVAPGTVGTLVGIIFYIIFSSLNIESYLALTIFAFIVGIGLCQKSSDLLGVHDHSGIVWDEIVGYLVTMLFAPFAWQWIILGFVYFRIFDILKPYPISWVDKHVHGGFGIMIDDVLASIYALIALQLTILLFS